MQLPKHTTTTPLSYSSVGKMVDASSRRDMSKVHKMRKGIFIKPWEGMEVIDEVISEATVSSAPPGSRGAPLMSSPRVNPVLVEKEIAETSSSLMGTFLTATAGDLEDLPAKGKKTVEEEIVIPTFKKKKVIQTKKIKASAAFSCPQRPSPGDELRGRAPAVGKYTPKYGVVERNNGKVVLPKHNPRASTPLGTSSKMHSGETMNSTMQQGLGSTFAGTVGTGGDLDTTQAFSADFASKSFTATNKDLKKMEASGVMLPTSNIDDRATMLRRAYNAQKRPLEAHEYRKYEVRSCATPFKSRVERTVEPTTNDLCYHPLPDPGATTHAGGKIRPGSREQDFKAPAGPCGPNIYYEVKKKDTAPGCLQFSRCVSRADDRAHADGKKLTPPQSLIYNVNMDGLSTKNRVRSTTPFDKQVVRPATQQASTVEPVNPYFDSVVTRKKRGFVDMSRMVRNDEPYAEDEAAVARSAAMREDASYSLVHRASPSVSFTQSKVKDTNSGGAGASAPLYDVNDISIRRSRPACFMARTDRSSPVMREGVCKPVQTVYDVKDMGHVTNVDIGSQLSRNGRESRYNAKSTNADVVYELPAERPRSIVPFSKLKARV